MITIRPKALLVDCYGTLVEEDDRLIMDIAGRIARASGNGATGEEVTAAWAAAFSGMCLECNGDRFLLQREIERLALGSILERFLAPLSREALLAELFAQWGAPAIYPESKRVLETCPLPKVLVSNIDDVDLQAALACHGLAGHFAHVVTSEHCRAYKPDPRPFREALSALGLAPEEVLHVGDSWTSDVQGAGALGLPVLWVNRKGLWGQPGEGGRPVRPGEHQPTFTAGSLEGLLEVVGG